MNDELPEGWNLVPLEQVLMPGGLFDGPFGSNLKTSDYVNAGVRVVRLENIGHLQFDATKRTFVSHRKYESLMRHRVCEGDIIFGSFVDGDVRVCVLPPLDTLAIAKADCFCIRSQRDVADRRFLAYYFATPDVRDALIGQIHGATRPRINTKQLRQLDIHLPPFPEQQRIAEKVAAVLESVQTCSVRLKRFPDILKRFRQAVLAAACAGKLTTDWRAGRGLEVGDDELPVGWQEVCVGDVIDHLKYGTAQKCTPEKHGTPVLRIPNVAKGVIDHGDLKYAVLPAKELKSLSLLPGDVLIIRSNGSVSLVGRSALVRKEEKGFAYAGYLIRIRPRPSVIDPRFLNLVLGSYDVRLQIEVEARSTSGVNNINSEEVRALRFLLPELDEQKKVLERVEEMFKLADRLEARYEKAKAQVNKLTQSVLAKAFRGELVPTEAGLARTEGRSYETAEQLLARIRATPESNGSKRTAGRKGRRQG